MATVKIWSNTTVRSFLSRHRPRFWGSHDPASITRRSCRQPKRSLSGAGSTRSTPAGPSSEVEGFRRSLGEKGLMWGETGSGPPCERWASKGSIRGQISANGLVRTRSIPIFSGISRPNIPTTSGESTSPTSACLTDGCTSWRSSTGIPGMSSPGRWIRRSRCRLFLTVWTGLLRPLSRTFSTATRGAISRVTVIWNVFFPGTSRSAWTERDAPSTTFSPNGSGEASSTRRCTSMSTIVLDKPERESEPGSNSITRKDPTNPWITKLLGKCFLKETNQDLLQPETERKSLIKRDTVSHINVLKNRQKTVLTKPPTSPFGRMARQDRLVHGAYTVEMKGESMRYVELNITHVMCSKQLCGVCL